MDLLGKLGFSATVMLLGMVIVFIGLIILIAAIKIVSTLLRKAPLETTAPAAIPAAPVVAVAAPVATAPAGKPVEAGDQLAVVAAITSVILASEGAGKKMVVRSIRRLA